MRFAPVMGRRYLHVHTCKCKSLLSTTLPFAYRPNAVLLASHTGWSFGRVSWFACIKGLFQICLRGVDKQCVLFWNYKADHFICKTKQVIICDAIFVVEILLGARSSPAPPFGAWRGSLLGLPPVSQSLQMATRFVSHIKWPAFCARRVYFIWPCSTLQFWSECLCVWDDEQLLSSKWSLCINDSVWYSKWSLCMISHHKFLFWT